MTESKKFKFADRVRAVIRDSEGGWEVGDEFIVSENINGEEIIVDNDDCFRFINDGGNVGEFELVSREWGAEIAVNGTKPAWLADDTPCMIYAGDRWFGANGGNKAGRWHWDKNSDAICLPADHFAYVAVDKGFEPWGGGDSAPEDWDGGDVLLRNGDMLSYANDWRRGSEYDLDIIGYRKRTEAPEQPTPKSPVDWSKPIEAVRKSDGFVFPVTLNGGWDSRGNYMTNEIPDPANTNKYWHEDGTDPCHHNKWFVRNVADADTVTVKRMTEAQADRLIEEHDYSITNVLNSLGIIKPDARAEKFARKTGYEVTPAVEAALAWAERAA